MPVPSSYNDITQDSKIRDFIGWVWYEKEVWVPARWIQDQGARIMLRVGSAHYYSVLVSTWEAYQWFFSLYFIMHTLSSWFLHACNLVQVSCCLWLIWLVTVSGLTHGSVILPMLQWVNGIKMTEHAGGHLPFEADVGGVLRQSTESACRITIAVNNTLTLETLPPGTIQYMNDRTRLDTASVHIVALKKCLATEKSQFP